MATRRPTVTRAIAGQILKHPLDPTFPQRYLVQFTDGYLKELVHECREAIGAAHARVEEADRGEVAARNAGHGGRADALAVTGREYRKEKRRLFGRLNAIIRQLKANGEAIPRL